MGDIAEMMIEGVLCNGCGVYLDGEETGYPRWCDDKDCQLIKKQVEENE